MVVQHTSAMVFFCELLVLPVHLYTLQCQIVFHGGNTFHVEITFSGATTDVYFCYILELLVALFKVQFVDGCPATRARTADAQKLDFLAGICRNMAVKAVLFVCCCQCSILWCCLLNTHMCTVVSVRVREK